MNKIVVQVATIMILLVLSSCEKEIHPTTETPPLLSGTRNGIHYNNTTVGGTLDKYCNNFLHLGITANKGMDVWQDYLNIGYIPFKIGKHQVGKGKISGLRNCSDMFQKGTNAELVVQNNGRPMDYDNIQAMYTCDTDEFNKVTISRLDTNSMTLEGSINLKLKKYFQHKYYEVADSIIIMSNLKFKIKYRIIK